jgi:hypothetical protein
MPTKAGISEPLAVPALRGRALLVEVRQLLINCLVVGVLYSLFTTGSRGGTTVTSAPGQPAYEVNLTLHPSPIIYVAIAAACFYSIHRVLTHVTDEAAAIGVFRRASLVVVLIAACSVVIADVWFFASPLAGWPSPGTWIAPFPFGSQDVSTKMMTRS